MALAPKYAISEKSTIFVQFLWNFVKIITSWGNYFHQVLWGLKKNCGFFTIGQCLSVSGFVLLRPYIDEPPIGSNYWLLLMFSIWVYIDEPLIGSNYPLVCSACSILKVPFSFSFVNQFSFSYCYRLRWLVW